MAIAGAAAFALGCAAGNLPATSTKHTAPTAVQPVTQPPSQPAPAAKPAQAQAATSVDRPSLSRVLGQTIIARFIGSSPSGAFLARVRAGRIGGVILFAENVAGGESATRSVIERLQQAAAEGKNPPLLIMTDQEGGEVRRLTWAPPVRAPLSMSSGVARAEGEATGEALRSVGINVDLAPVADVERVAGSFLHTRAFGRDPTVVAENACLFAEGLAKEGVGYTLKHFPGLGRALTNTDTQPTTIQASAADLRADYLPYQTCGAQPGALVMVSSAIYPSLGSSGPAVLTPQIYSSELPSATGGTPVTISDDLQAAGLQAESAPAERAINAGLDLLLYAQTEAGSETAFQRLLDVAKSGGIRRERLEAARLAILGLKGTVAGATASSTGVPVEAQEPTPESSGTPETIPPQVETEK